MFSIESSESQFTDDSCAMNLHNNGEIKLGKKVENFPSNLMREILAGCIGIYYPRVCLHIKLDLCFRFFFQFIEYPSQEHHSFLFDFQHLCLISALNCIVYSPLITRFDINVFGGLPWLCSPSITFGIRYEYSIVIYLAYVVYYSRSMMGIWKFSRYSDKIYRRNENRPSNIVNSWQFSWALYLQKIWTENFIGYYGAIL